MTHSTPPTPDPQPRTFVPFSVSAVRTTYVTPETAEVAKLALSAPAAGTTPTGSTSPAAPAGLVELAAALRTAAGLPDALIVVVDGFTTGAEAGAMSCLPVAQVRLGVDLLEEHNSVRLQGTLAHEIAHHALGHLSGSNLWRRIAAGCGIGALLALAGHLPGGLVVALAAVAAVNYLLAARVGQLQEYDADIYSARLLEQVGRDGMAIVAATLAALPAPSIWARTIGRLISTHPTPAVRLRVLASGRLPSWHGAGFR